MSDSSPTASRIATYLPRWAGPGGSRLAGPDEDSVTLAVSAGTLALAGAPAERVVVVTREPVLIEGGSAAVLCAGLGLPADTEVVERLGGAAAALDAAATAAQGTLVVGVDVAGPSGAGALLVGDDGPLVLAARVQRSLPVRARHLDGSVYEDDDPRLVRERATRASVEAAGLGEKPAVLAGLGERDAKAFSAADPPVLPTTGASSPFFALAALSGRAGGGLVAAVEQAALAAASFRGGVPVAACARPALDPPKLRVHPGPEMKIALTAYERAFEPKLRWEAGRCERCETLAFPPRYRCLGCGAEQGSTPTPLPRTGEVYTATTIHVPVPGLQTPYTLAVVQLDGVDVRVLVTVTDCLPGSVDIGHRGRMVLRRVAMRSGVPDYGYAFSPEVTS